VSAELKDGDVAASCAKIVSDLGFPRRISGGLLHDKPVATGSEPSVEHSGEQCVPGSIAMDGGGDAGLLAGWAAEAGVGCWGSVDGSNIFKSRYPRKGRGQAFAPPRVIFAERHGLVACALHAEGVTADAGEKIEHPQAGHQRLPRASQT
jgi:hypothetical protein